MPRKKVFVDLDADARFIEQQQAAVPSYVEWRARQCIAEVIVARRVAVVSEFLL